MPGDRIMAYPQATPRLGVLVPRTSALHVWPPRIGRLIPSRPHGEKFGYVKVTVTLPPELYELIMKETTKRKLAKEPNPQVSAVVREAFGQDA